MFGSSFFILLPSSFFLLLLLPSSPSSFFSYLLLLLPFLLRPFSVKHFAYAASAVLCLISQVVMAQQRSWKLYDDWKEVAHSRSSYRNQRRSNNKSYGWKWKPSTACQFEGCRGWVRSSEAFLLSTVYPSFARAGSSEIP